MVQIHGRLIQNISTGFPVAKIAEKAVRMSVFLTTWHLFWVPN